MVVMVLEKVPKRLKGELSRWCQEVTTGVFVGKMSALVRDLLWEKCTEKSDSGRVYMLYRTNNEQGYAIRMFNDPQRTVIDAEGLQLVALRNAAWEQVCAEFFDKPNVKE